MQQQKRLKEEFDIQKAELEANLIEKQQVYQRDLDLKAEKDRDYLKRQEDELQQAVEKRRAELEDEA